MRLQDDLAAEMRPAFQCLSELGRPEERESHHSLRIAAIDEIADEGPVELRSAVHRAEQRQRGDCGGV
ncbi:MAG: hypothetical protein F4020_06375 [Gammaproteobacteria bacterium]|nr:hypothetical protein [Gammaproteobacteria bacterium]